VWGEQPADDRRAVLDAFRAGRLQILCNFGVLAEGFDAPNVSALVLARPTRSVTLARQQLGRGLRIYPGKTDCVVAEGIPRIADPRQVTVGAILPQPEAEIDFGGSGSNHSRLLLLDPRFTGEWRWLAIGGNGSDGFVAEAAPGLRLWLINDPVSGLWRAGWTEQTMRRRVVALSAAPLVLAEVQDLAARWLARHGSEKFGHEGAAWRERPASQKQILVLDRLLGAPARLGERVDAELTAGQASDLIGGFFAEQDAERVRAALWRGRGNIYA
jgi:hypothetical protein